MNHEKSKVPVADLENLYKIFTVPESDNSTLGQIDRNISKNLFGFLTDHIVSSPHSFQDLDEHFFKSAVPEKPSFVSDEAEFLLENIVAKSVHTSSPKFIGHMTSALPYFMLPISKMMIALNQNLVKVETSKVFTPLERQVLAMIHRMIYDKKEAFYAENIQNPNTALGAFCSNGTIANITSLWVALNQLFPVKPGFDGLADEGLYAAISEYGYKGVVVLVSKRGHYSLQKSANILGLGKKNLIAIDIDSDNRIKIDALEKKIKELKEKNIAVAAIVGIAGTTETGSIDPLDDLADIAKRENISFHVDAAWGGPTLFSKKYKHLLKGIEKADSVTFDAHKQMYVPMGAAMAIFKSEKSLHTIEHHANYIIRKGSHDLGRRTLEGSRPGMALLVYSGLKIISRSGYELLINLGIEKAKTFAQIINEQQDFELISEPELNILTYRYIPKDVKSVLATSNKEDMYKINEFINKLTISIQKEQRDAGSSFVSRTSLEPKKYSGQTITVFRVVLANPLTKTSHLYEILEEQRKVSQNLMKN